MGGGNSTECYSHGDCPSGEPFCYDDGLWAPYCASCDWCEYCEYGVDGTCGTCDPDQYPVWGSNECSSNEGDGGCSSHWDCPCSHPFCHDHTWSGDGVWTGEGVCSTCDECHTCYDGIDSTCGSCDPNVYPLHESGQCYSQSHCGTVGTALFLVGHLVGIVVGAIVFSVLCCCCCWGFWKWSHQSNGAEAERAMPKVAVPQPQGQYPVAAVPMVPMMPVAVEGNGNGNEVRQWMRDNVRLPGYAEVLIGNGYDSLENVKRVSAADLASMGIGKVGHQKAIMAEIERLRARTPGAVGQQQGLLMDPQPVPQAPNMAEYQYSAEQ